MNRFNTSLTRNLTSIFSKANNETARRKSVKDSDIYISLFVNFDKMKDWNFYFPNFNYTKVILRYNNKIQ